MYGKLRGEAEQAARLPATTTSTAPTCCSSDLVQRWEMGGARFNRDKSVRPSPRTNAQGTRIGGLRLRKPRYRRVLFARFWPPLARFSAPISSRRISFGFFRRGLPG